MERNQPGYKLIFIGGILLAAIITNVAGSVEGAAPATTELEERVASLEAARDLHLEECKRRSNNVPQRR